MKRLLCTLSLMFVCAVVLAEVTEHPVLVVKSWSSSWNEFEATIDNPSTQPQTAYFVVKFVMNGTQHLWGWEFEVPAETLLHISITFPMPIQVLEVKVYANGFPGAVVEEPDPVSNSVVVTTEPR